MRTPCLSRPPSLPSPLFHPKQHLPKQHPQTNPPKAPHHHHHVPSPPRPPHRRPILHLLLRLPHPPSTILRTHFSTSYSSSILVHEHGLPQLAPFLGRPFHGLDGAAAYFELIGQCLSYADMTFSDYVVDPVAGRVSVRGAARFTWTETGQSWDEVFTYVLGFDDELRVVRYEIWADSGAAYLASKGLLGVDEAVARE